jgi:hypothetical protein
MIINGPTVRGSACACSSYHANGPTVGITEHKNAVEHNATSTSAAALLYSFICAYQGLQGTAVVFRGWVAASLSLHLLSHFKV